MRHTPEITKYTPDVLKAICKEHGVTKRKYRLYTLRFIHQQLSVILNRPGPINDRDRGMLQDLDNEVRLAIGDEQP